MLKQVFNKEQLSKVMLSADVWKWQLLRNHGSVENAINHVVASWNKNSLELSELVAGRAKGKPTFRPSNVVDHFTLRLLDRFIRRVYKVRQSDRNRIIKQLICALKDSGAHHILRLDIKNCYENIQLKSLIDKFESDLILSPECISLLKQINKSLINNHGVNGLPRGLCISPTLAELYLEVLDKKIASIPEVIYSARYVDDIVIILPASKREPIESQIELTINEMNLKVNHDSGKYYSNNTSSAKFNFLGYSISVLNNQRKPNTVSVTISQSKLNKIKSRITKSFICYKNDQRINLLKRRLEYISMLKVVKKGENGDLLAGIAHNYKYVTDSFECLKKVDGFLFNQLNHHRYNLCPQHKNRVERISIFSNVKNSKIGNFTKTQTSEIMRAWNNA